MIKAEFSIRGADASFTVSGHSGSAESGRDIVCAAVSSAAFMAANTITEILGVDASAEADDGYMNVSFVNSEAAADIVRGLRLHLEQLSRQYPQFVKVTTEV
ncbi:MAG: ribosomal-processing cysteine protease Prp [Oscillospiraceae bacterium]|nr:ribosomal-processing cysteine protease Prp [Oscillospiraceae bacterium]